MSFKSVLTSFHVLIYAYMNVCACKRSKIQRWNAISTELTTWHTPSREIIPCLLGSLYLEQSQLPFIIKLFNSLPEPDNHRVLVMIACRQHGNNYKNKNYRISCVQNVVIDTYFICRHSDLKKKKIWSGLWYIFFIERNSWHDEILISLHFFSQIIKLLKFMWNLWLIK